MSQVVTNHLGVNDLHGSHLDPGRTHFRGELKKARASDYTIEAVIDELIDNPWDKATRIDVDISYSTNLLTTITISDDYVNGVENLNASGIDNPMNMTHERGGQDDGAEISQFGVGGKAAPMAAAEKYSMLTYSENQCTEVTANWEEMAAREDATESYIFNKFSRTQDEYNARHKFHSGTKIELSAIRPEMSEGNRSDIDDNIKKHLSETYGDKIKEGKTKLFLNSIEIHPGMSYFEEPQCIPFNQNEIGRAHV